MTFENPSNITDLNSTLYYIHEVTGYWFFPVIILVLFFVVLLSIILSTRRENWIEGMTIASFICMPITTIFFYLHYVSLTTVTINMILLTLSFIALIFWNRK